jgi:hypothetical protein
MSAVAGEQLIGGISYTISRLPTRTELIINGLAVVRR